MTTIEKFAQFLDIPVESFEKPAITKEERTEAQALYTAIMTDTLIEEDEADE